MRCGCGANELAFVFVCSINVGTGKTEERRLLTGVHVVSDIFCNVCNNRLGWKYVGERASVYITNEQAQVTDISFDHRFAQTRKRKSTKRASIS